MRHSLLFLTAAALFTLVSAESALAQRHEILAFNSCIREFNDPEMYNYLTFKNNCSQSLTIVYVAKDGSGGSGTMDLRPGGKDSVGRLADDRVPKVGDFQLYVCLVGYLPMDEKGKVVSKPRSNFECKPKAQ